MKLTKKYSVVSTLLVATLMFVVGCSESGSNDVLKKDSSYYERLLKARSEAVSRGDRSFLNPDTGIRYMANAYKSDEEYILGIKRSDKKEAEKIAKKEARKKRLAEIRASLDNPTKEQKMYFEKLIAEKNKSVSEGEKYITYDNGNLSVDPDMSNEEFLLIIKRLEASRILQREELVVHVATSKKHTSELQIKLKKGEKIACPRATHKTNKVFICSNKSGTEIWGISTWESIFVPIADNHAAIEEETKMVY